MVSPGCLVAARLSSLTIVGLLLLGHATPDLPPNSIKNLHWAPLASLAELPPRSWPTRPGPTGPDKRTLSR